MRSVPFFSALLTVMLSVAGVLTGCQSPKVRVPVGRGPTLTTRNNCYSLLHGVLDDEKDVSLLRFFKREQADVKTLVKRIAANAAVGAKLLEEFAAHDPSIRLDDLRLPPARPPRGRRSLPPSRRNYWASPETDLS